MIFKLLIQDARSNPLLFGPDADKKSGKGASAADESGGRDDKKDQRKKKAQGKYCSSSSSTIVTDLFIHDLY